VEQNPVAAYFTVAARGESYRNLAYVLLALPLAVVYFVVLIVGFTTGLALLLVLIGFVLWYGVLWIAFGFANFERMLARSFFSLELPSRLRPEATGLRAEIGQMMRNPSTWLELVYLLIKFPVALVSFVITIAMFATSLYFIIAIPFYDQAWYRVRIGDLVIQSLAGAVVVTVLGVLLLFLSFHVSNWLARIHRWLANFFLSDRSLVGSK
jgi:hypothetical protein